MSITQAKVAIITVTFNSSGFIDNYLQAITPFINSTSHELILIDNASTDDTIDQVKQHIKQHKLQNNIHIIPLAENVGFGRGCNTGITKALEIKAAYMWFLNPDTEALTDSADKLLSLFQTNKTVDFAGSLLTNEHKQIRAGAFRFPTIINVCLSSLKLGFLDKLLKNHTTAIPIENHPYQADWLTGASFMARSHCVEALGGFDPTFFLYFEEVDLFYRAKQKGFTVWCCSDSQIFHISGASTGINNQKNDKSQHIKKYTPTKRQPSYWFESRRYFYLSNYGKLYFTAVDLCQVSCLILWKLRAKLQKKDDDTPSHFIRDIIKYSYLNHLLTRIFSR